MNFDVAFSTGNSHRICQDYARANTLGQYVILSDGCSGSPDTDWGSRLLIKSAEQYIGHDNMNHLAIAAASAHADGLHLPQECLDATLLCIRPKIVFVDGKAECYYRVSIYGDGVFSGVRKDGTIDILDVSFTDGYPRYPSYLLDEGRMATMQDKNKRNGGLFRNLVSHHILPDGKRTSECSQNNVEFTELVVKDSDYDTVAIFSDGVHSVYKIVDGTKETIPMPTVVGMLMGFKNYAGDFVQRRYNAFQKDLIKNGWTHYDDISMGVVYLGE